MGRDLYAFWMTHQGYRPYRDYWWQYGPVMPYYFSFFFQAAGAGLASVRIGLGLLFFLCALFSFRTLRVLVSSVPAFLASLAFLSLDIGFVPGSAGLINITHTFNHFGTYPFLLLAVGSLWKYFLTRKPRWIYAGAAAIAGMSAVKIHAGLTSCFAFFLAILAEEGFRVFRDRKKIQLPRLHLGLAAAVWASLVFTIYAPFFRGLSWEWIDRCFTISTGKAFMEDRYTVLQNLKHLVLRFTVWDRGRLFWLAGFSGIGFLGFLGMKNLEQDRKPFFIKAYFSLLLFGVNAIDYFVDGNIHRVDFWFFPLWVLVAGLSLEALKTLLPSGSRISLALLSFCLLLVLPVLNLREALGWQVPGRYLDFPNGKVFMGGDMESVNVIQKGSAFIRDHTRPTERILALPYDPLYCFLAGRRHAVRELWFGRAALITPREEAGIIQAVEAQKVPLVILSNQAEIPGFGFGYFGRTHCQKLAEYLTGHYQEVKTFGSWDIRNPNRHSIKILMRKLDLPAENR